MNAKLKFLNPDGGVEISEIQTAIQFLRSKKLEQEKSYETTQVFYSTWKFNLKKELREKEKELQKSQNLNNELATEIEKLKNLLKVSEGIAKNYKSVVEDSKSEVLRIKKEYERKLDDEARLVDIKVYFPIRFKLNFK